MAGDILITDTLFIFDEHEQQINDAGYKVDRLEEPNASEELLIERLEGKVGYILGGVEQVTERVLASTNGLKVISFTGAGYTEFVPGHKLAEEMGIAITAAVGQNAPAVAELAITFALMGTREVASLTHPEGEKFKTVKGASESTLGVIGYGHIGRLVVEKALAMGYSVLVNSRREIEKLPANVRQVDLETLVSESDVLSIHVDKENGTNVLNSDMIDKLKHNATVVNVAFAHALDAESLEARVRDTDIKVFSDQKLGFKDEYGPGRVVETNLQSGFNTYYALKAVSDQTTRSLLNVLETGRDEYRMV